MSGRPASGEEPSASDLIVGFAGMTHLGLVSAVATAAKGFRTICYDPDLALTSSLAAGRLPVTEPGLDDLVRSVAGKQLFFTSDIAALAECDVVYVSRDVPTDEAGGSDLSGIQVVILAISEVLRPESILVILCQVPPGFTRAVTAVPASRLYYQVETLVFGQAVKRALEPERTIVGCQDPMAPLDARYHTVLAAFGCPLLPMRYESAELAKIAINCCLVSSISVANTLAEICENIGADWSEIVPALRLDARIGPHAYLAPGLGIAGGNLERDLATVIQLSERYDTDSNVVHGWLANSRHRRDWAGRTIRDALLSKKPDATLAVWGLAYKENTNSIKNSPAIATINGLPNTRFVVHDPVVPATVIAHRLVSEVNEPLQAVEQAEALMILTPWPQYRAILPRDIACALRGRIVLDPYGVLDRRDALAAGLDYYTLGLRKTGNG